MDPDSVIMKATLGCLSLEDLPDEPRTWSPVAAVVCSQLIDSEKVWA